MAQTQTSAPPPIGPQPGDLLPDFTVRTLDGRTIHRRHYKSRRHLVLGFVAPGAEELLAALATYYPAFRAAGGDLLVALNGAAPVTTGDYPYPLVSGLDAAELRRRCGIVEPAALIVCDRYGEVVLRVAAGDTLPLDEALAALEWLEMRCSL